ncbi:MAG: TIGR02266 family protein [Proteobacteria bacterium]|nr:TIGR02266 family protein [Pseudomonadota bacterium]MCP4917694.1 TIGR02266 family protein [Pseudomonadota bacterium]
MSAALKTIEHRTMRRLPVRVLVEYEALAEFLEDYTANLSIGGMFIATDTPLDIGTRFRLRFSVPGRKKPIETVGEVRWSVPRAEAGAMNPGMGVQFDALVGSELRALQRLMDAYDDDNVVPLRG